MFNEQIKTNLTRDIESHIQEHGFKKWRILLEKYDYVPESTFWRYVEIEKKGRERREKLNEKAEIALDGDVRDTSFAGLTKLISESMPQKMFIGTDDIERAWRQNEKDIEALRQLSIDENGLVKNVKLLEKCIKMQYELAKQGVELEKRKEKQYKSFCYLAAHTKYLNKAIEMAADVSQELADDIYDMIKDSDINELCDNIDAEDFELWKQYS